MKIDGKELDRKAHRQARREVLPRDSRYVTKVDTGTKRDMLEQIEEKEFGEALDELWWAQ